MPAWDPLSWTPLPPPPEPSNPPALQKQQPSHLLLDAQLIGTKIKVSVTGGEHKDKEMAISVVQVDRQMSIQFTHYSTSGYLPLEHVSPKHPNLLRDNGPLIVVEGEHCGKCVRQIHHQYENDQLVVMLAVLHQTEDGHESLSEEHLELSSNELCVGHETKEEKKRINQLMSGLHSEAWEIYVK